MDHYLFVDGNYFYKALESLAKKWFGGDFPEIDYKMLKGGRRKAFYYDAIPVRADGEQASDYEHRTADKEIFLEHISAQDAFHVRNGDAVYRKGRGHEQKMVDVQLAVEVMSFASRRVISHATLIAGDIDFKPLVDAIIAMGIDVTIMYEPGHASTRFIRSADRAIPINLPQLLGWLTTDFASRHSVPRACHKSTFDYEDATHLHIWNEPEHGKCHLIQIPGAFVLRGGKDANGNYLYVTYHDRQLLTEYAKDVFNITVPVVI